ncbi:MAG TPA: hypothetical protein DD381_13355 [Lentisphaeria bacterium]|nr:MAG: hypothetical protein A2X47_11030 [Lentisphaerae bacterium GWF2_38_69]HBM17308.1 hypothetical protein [Lentisphaeria bacterium]
MRKVKLLSAILATLIGLSIGAFAQDKHNDPNQIKGTQTLCPVMNEPIDKDLYVDYEGKRIYVCCYGCLDTVKEDPAKYIKQLESKGVILEKVPDANAKDQAAAPTVSAQDNSAAHQH